MHHLCREEEGEEEEETIYPRYAYNEKGEYDIVLHFCMCPTYGLYSGVEEEEDAVIEKVSYVEKNTVPIIYPSLNDYSRLTYDSPIIKMLISKRIDDKPSECFLHIAMFVKDINSWTYRKSAIGYNSDQHRFKNMNMRYHAEISALNKLYNIYRNRKIKHKKLNLIVIRINRIGELCESMPCFKCVKELERRAKHMIDHIYYSRADRSISKIKFMDMVENENMHFGKTWTHKN